MHSKPRKRTAERLTCRESWKSCLPAKTKARARCHLHSCNLLARYGRALKQFLRESEKVKLHAGNQRQVRRHHRREQRRSQVRESPRASRRKSIVRDRILVALATSNERNFSFKLTCIFSVGFHLFGVQFIALPSLRRRPARSRR